MSELKLRCSGVWISWSLRCVERRVLRVSGAKVRTAADFKGAVEESGVRILNSLENFFGLELVASLAVRVPPVDSNEFLRLELCEFNSSSAEKKSSEWFSLDTETVLCTSFRNSFSAGLSLTPKECCDSEALTLNQKYLNISYQVLRSF